MGGILRRPEQAQEVAKHLSVLTLLAENEPSKSRGESIAFVVKRHNAARLADASMNQDADLVQELIAGGTDPNLSDEDGRLALHAAVTGGNVEMVNCLLAARANPDCIEQAGACTPLQIAAWQGNTSAMRSLLEARASPNVPNTKGETPLFTAAVNGHKQAVQTLLSHGSDANRPALQGGRLVTPLQAAVEGRCGEVATYLRSMGAQTSPVSRTSFSKQSEYGKAGVPLQAAHCRNEEYHAKRRLLSFRTTGSPQKPSSQLESPTSSKLFSPHDPEAVCKVASGGSKRRGDRGDRCFPFVGGA